MSCSMLTESAVPEVSLAPFQRASEWACPVEGSPADPASGGSGASIDTGAPPRMPIARFDPSLVAAVKRATEILQTDDGWSKEEAAATIAVLAKKFQHSKRRTGQTSDTTAKSGEESKPISQLDQPQTQGLQHEHGLQSSPWTPTAGLEGLSTTSGQQEETTAGAAPSPPSAAAAQQGSRLGPLLADFGKAVCTTSTPGHSMPTEPAAGDEGPAGDGGTTLATEPAPSAADTGTLLQPAPAAAGGISDAGGRVDVPVDDMRDATLAGVASNARDSPEDNATPARQSHTPDAASGTITGEQQHVEPAAKQHCAVQHTAEAEDGLAQGRTGCEVGSGCTDTARRDSASNLATAAGTTQACQPSGTAPNTCAPAGRLQLDAASAAAVAAAAKAASKIAATAAVTGFAASDVLSDAGGFQADPAAELPVDLGVITRASSPPVAEGSSSCAEPMAHKQPGMAAAETAATSACTTAEFASHCLIGSLQDVLAHQAMQPGGVNQAQLPLALIQLLQSEQPQALPLMSALLRYGNLRPLVADAFKVRLSSYLQQQHQGAHATKHGSSMEATGAAEAQAEVGDAGIAVADPAAAAEHEDAVKKQMKQSLLGVCSESRSATSTAGGSQASADLGCTEIAVKRKRVRQPSAKATATASTSNATCSERPQKRHVTDRTAAKAGAAAAASAVPVEPAVASKPKRGRPAKSTKLAEAHAATRPPPEANPRCSDSWPAATHAPGAQALDSSNMAVSAERLTALLTKDVHPAAWGGWPYGSTPHQRGLTAASSIKAGDFQQQPHQPLPLHQTYDTSCIADCPTLLERLAVLPDAAVQHVLDMASKLPADMPLHWKQTVLLQAADSAVNMLQLQHVPQPLQQQMDLITPAVVAELPTLHTHGHVPAAGSTTAAPALDATASACLPLCAGSSLGATLANTAQAVNTSRCPTEDWAMLPGLMAAAESHPRLSSMSADERKTLLKQLLRKHQARQAGGMQAGSEQQQQPVGMLQGNLLQKAGHTSSFSGVAQVPWNAASTPSAAATSFGPLDAAPGNSSCVADDATWLQGIPGVHPPLGVLSQHQTCDAPNVQPATHVARYLSGEKQQTHALMDRACSTVYNTPLAGSASAASHVDIYSVGIGNTPSAAAADAVAAPVVCPGLSASTWDSSHLQGLMSCAKPGMRQQYMEKLQQQLELHGMTKKQLVDLKKQQGAVAALHSTGMLSLDLRKRSYSTAGSLTVTEAAAIMDPATAAALTVQQRQQVHQQQLKLGPDQQAWLQQQQQASVGVLADSDSVLLAQQLWHGGVGLQQQGGQAAELSLPSGHTVHGSNSKLALDNSSKPGLGLSGASAGSMSGAHAAGNVLHEQQHLAGSSTMPNPHQMPHHSLGLAQQQYMMHHQHQPAVTAASSAALAWGAAGLAWQQGLHISSSAALDPPVLQLPPIKVTQPAATAAAAVSKTSHLQACRGMLAAAVTHSAAGGVEGQQTSKTGAAGSMQGEGQGTCTNPRHTVGNAQLLQPLDLPGSLGELGATDADGIAVSPFGQLDLNAADVDALLSGFDPHVGL